MHTASPTSRLAYWCRKLGEQPHNLIAEAIAEQMR